MKTNEPSRALLTVIYLLVASFLTTSIAIAAPRAFWPSPQQRPVEASHRSNASQASGTVVAGLVNAETGAPIRVVSRLANDRLPAHANLADALAFIDHRPERFGVAGHDLEVLHAGRVMGKYYFTARQTVDGHPVIGTRVLLRAAADGGIGLWGANVARGHEADAWQGSLTQAMAANALADYAEIKANAVPFSNRVWVRAGDALIAAWELTVAGERPDQRAHGLVNANTGEVLGYYSDVQYDDLQGVVTGPVWPIQIQEIPQQWALPFQEVQAGGATVETDSAGNFIATGFANGEEVNVTMRLQGSWVNVSNEDQTDALLDTTLTAPWSDTLEWVQPRDGRMDEFNMFYHVNFIHSYYKLLDPAFTGMDYQVPATVGYDTNYDNAFWNGYGMYFGTGGGTLRNLAMFSDVIYHEYTHGVTGYIYPAGTLPYNGQSGAMNEAWSDYFPCSIHNYSTLSPGIYLSGGNQPLRDLDNNKRFPENWAGEVHADGLIIGGAMWHTRELIDDPAYCDSIVHYARYGFANTFEGFLVELLTADDDNGNLSDGTPHGSAIYEGFGRHGIGPGDDPNLVITRFDLNETDPDRILAPGEQASIDLTLFNDVLLFPPPAQGVTIAASAGDGIVWDTGEATVAQIDAGAEAVLDNALSFHVAEDAQTRYDYIHLSISANDGAYQIEDSLRVVVGTPEVLLVNDDSGDEDYTHYFARGMMEFDGAAFEEKTADTEPTADQLAAYPYVIWFTGDQASPISEAEAEMLVNYVEAGGNLVLSGQYIGPQLGQRPNLMNLLGITGYLSNLDEYGGRGVEGEPISEGMMFVIIGVTGASNQVQIGGLQTAEDTRPIYQYFQSQATAATFRSVPDGGSAAFFSFGLEAVTGVSTSHSLGEILGPVMNAMGYLVSVPEDHRGEAVPLAYDLSAPWPNPFNPDTRVAFTLPRAGQVRLSVFDILGREVLRPVDGVRTAGRHQVTLDLGSFSSGTYFLRLESDQGVRVRKALLLK